MPYLKKGFGFNVDGNFARAKDDLEIELAPKEYAKSGHIIGYISGDPNSALSFMRSKRIRVHVLKSAISETKENPKGRKTPYFLQWTNGDRSQAFATLKEAKEFHARVRRRGTIVKESSSHFKGHKMAQSPYTRVSKPKRKASAKQIAWRKKFAAMARAGVLRSNPKRKKSYKTKSDPFGVGHKKGVHIVQSHRANDPRDKFFYVKRDNETVASFHTLSDAKSYARTMHKRTNAKIAVYKGYD